MNSGIFHLGCNGHTLDGENRNGVWFWKSSVAELDGQRTVSADAIAGKFMDHALAGAVAVKRQMEKLPRRRKS